MQWPAGEAARRRRGADARRQAGAARDVSPLSPIYPTLPIPACPTLPACHRYATAQKTKRLWTDFEGASWPVITSVRRLKFKYPAHAALRRHVYRRDAFACCRCGVCALFVPIGYDGREALYTTSILRNGYHDVLVLDHILTLPAGGRNVVENLQTLCETCNRKKQREDKAAIAMFVAGVCS